MKRASLVSLVFLCSCSLDRAPILPQQQDEDAGPVDGGRIDGGGADAGTDAGTDGGRADGGPDACVPTGDLTDDCDLRDDDCDGTIDEDCECTPSTTRMCGPCSNGTQTCGTGGRWGDCMGGTSPVTYHRDMDGDSYGDAAVTMSSCTPMAGWVVDATDCNDDCVSCHPLGTETCNGLDDDCDGTADDGAGTLYYADADGDGHGDLTTTMRFCTPPTSGWVANFDDCDDTCRLCYPGFPHELCGDGNDNDCTGGTDTSCTCDWFSESGRDYAFCDTNESWSNGNDRCMGMGGYLASFETLAEGAAVWPHIDPYDMFIWIGGSDRGTEGTWEWTSGASIGTCNASSSMCSSCPMCNWEGGQPNSMSDDCLVLPDGWSGRWGDWGCSQTEGVLCELP